MSDAVLTLHFSLCSKMPSLYQDIPDWIDCAWGGPYEDDEEDEDDYAPATEHMRLPIYGPVNQDGVPLGFLLVAG